MLYIARISNNYTGKFGIPRQSGLVGNSLSKIVFEPAFRNPDALRGLEGFSHIWLIWEFSEVLNRRDGVSGSSVSRGDGVSGSPENRGDEAGGSPENRGDEAGGSPVTLRDAAGRLPVSREGEVGGSNEVEWSPTVRPPRLGGNERVGVFATRSPFRPNPIGLSCVQIEKIDLNTEEGPVIVVKGADLMNGTPIFDIKPYIPYADAHPDALAGFTAEREFSKVNVTIDPLAADKLTGEEISELVGLLEQDPRPAYKRGVKKTYRFSFAGKEIEFESDGDTIVVTNVL